MRVEDISFTKIASKLGNDITRMEIYHRWNRHLKDKLHVN
jgi:hypothetical protein